MSEPESCVQGRVVDAGGRPVAGARVLVHARDRGNSGHLVGFIANERGEFDGTVPPGESLVVAFEPSSKTGANYFNHVRFPHEVRIAAPPGGIASGIEVRLPFRPDELCTVAGRILVDGQGGNWGALVSIDGAPCVPEIRQEQQCWEAGEFKFVNVLPGARVVKYSGTKWFEAGEVAVELKAAEERALILEPSPRNKGDVARGTSPSNQVTLGAACSVKSRDARR